MLFRPREYSFVVCTRGLDDVTSSGLERQNAQPIIVTSAEVAAATIFDARFSAASHLTTQRLATTAGNAGIG